MWTSWDRRAAQRAMGAALLALLLAWLLTAATDEGNVPFGERLGRALPVTPVAAAIGAWVALAAGRAKGELRALACLGRSDWENARAAALGAALVAIVAGSAIAWSPRVDAAGFFPEIAQSSTARFEGLGTSGAFVDTEHGFRIERDGSLARIPAVPSAREDRVPPHGRFAAGLATALLGLAFALLASGKRPEAALLVLAAAVGTVTLLLFQAAAARLAPAMTAAIPSLVLLVVALARYRASPWHRT